VIASKKAVLLLIVLVPVTVVTWSCFVTYRYFQPMGPFCFDSNAGDAFLTESAALEKANLALQLALGNAGPWTIVAPAKRVLRDDLGDSLVKRTEDNVNDCEVQFSNERTAARVFVQVTLENRRIECWVVRGK
jgi:hypothetical protein